MKKDIRQLFDEFMHECEYVRMRRQETLKGYKISFSTFLKLVPGVTVQLLTPLTLTNYFKILHERKRIVGKGEIKSGIKKSTLASHWNKLSAFFSWLVAKKYMESNPFDEMQHPTPIYEDKKFLKKEEIEKILAAIHSHSSTLLLVKRNLVIFYLLLFCGLRKEELMLLQIRDIDFERKVLTIRADISKSAHTRQLPLHSTVLLYLKDYLKERKDYTTQYLIVSSSRDDKFSFDGLRHLINKLRLYSGVRFHLHQFRHTFAVNFLKSSNNLVTLKHLLGHKDIKMTMVYLRCLPTDGMRDDVENMSIDSFI